MIRNYFTTAIRSISRNWLYTLINVTGLSVGIVACIAIFLIVNFESSFETFHEHHDQLYRVTRSVDNPNGTVYSPVTPYPFNAAFRNDFPEVALSTQIHYHEEAVATVGKVKTKIRDMIFADSLFFDVLSFGVLTGNPKSALGEPGRVFLTETLADVILKDGQSHLTINNKLEL